MSELDKKTTKIGYPEKGLLQLLIFKFVYDKPGYGYDLVKKISAVTNDSLIIKTGTMYTTLRRMEKNGYIRSVWKTGDIGPSKRLYEITPLGKDYLLEMLHTISTRIHIVQMLLNFYRKELNGQI